MIFLGVGAFDHLKWTYDGACEQLFGPRRRKGFEQNFPKSQMPGGVPRGCWIFDLSATLHGKLYNINVVIYNKFEVLWKNATYRQVGNNLLWLYCLLLESRVARQPSRNFKRTLTESGSLLSTILKIIISTLKILSCFNMTTAKTRVTNVPLLDNPHQKLVKSP